MDEYSTDISIICISSLTTQRSSFVTFHLFYLLLFFLFRSKVFEEVFVIGKENYYIVLREDDN